jgi:hypothetical protein
LSAEEDKTVAAGTSPAEALDNAPEVGAQAAPEGTAPNAAEAPERKLRVARRDPDTEPAAGARPELLGSAQTTFFKRSRRSGLLPGVTTVNRGLTVIIVLMLLFAMIEIWANIQPVATPGFSADGAPVWIPPGTGRGPDLPPIENVLGSFSRKPIFSRLDGTTDEVVTQRVRVPDWEAYTRDNVNLIGMSAVVGNAAEDRREAIFFDAKTGQMHFLRVGQSLRVEEQDLRLTRIGDESAVLSDGTRDVEIK